MSEINSNFAEQNFCYMKKISLFLFLLVSTISNAQVWSKQEFNADPLKGVSQAYTSYVYTDYSVGSFIFWSSEPNQYRLHCSEGIFNRDCSSGTCGVFASIGLYDEHDNLIEMFTSWLRCESGKMDYLDTFRGSVMSTPIGQKRKCESIFRHIQHGKGYVRFVCPRYGRSDFDLKVPCLQSKQTVDMTNGAHVGDTILLLVNDVPTPHLVSGYKMSNDTLYNEYVKIENDSEQKEYTLDSDELVLYSDLFAQIDFFVDKLYTEYENYDAFGKQRVYLTSGQLKFSVAPMGRLINVKYEEVVPNEEYIKLKFILEKYYENDTRVNSVYINNAGTLMVDCRRK